MTVPMAGLGARDTEQTTPQVRSERIGASCAERTDAFALFYLRG